MSNPLAQLGDLGQSPWYDFITRDLVRSGALATFIADKGLKGMTSNPTIFQKAITGSSDYDDDMRSLAADGADAAAIVEGLMVSDVQAACDVFRPVYDASGNGDGTVSIEVAPTLAHDTAATIAEAERLWERVDRPNVMIKVPGTKEGLPAITHLLGKGINVNVTLLFSVERYLEVADAFMSGMEQRLASGGPIDTLHSVASFFVSRVDGQTDKAIKEGVPGAVELRHKMAIANAVNAYAEFRRLTGEARWRALAEKGAKPQRPLWASTSTKDPSLPDTLYVEALVAEHTVNTLPPATFDAYADHGNPALRLTPAAEEAAAATLSNYNAYGLRPLNDITDFLEADGVKKFADSWNELLSAVAEKAGEFTTA